MGEAMRVVGDLSAKIYCPIFVCNDICISFIELIFIYLITTYLIGKYVLLAKMSVVLFLP